MPPRNHLVEQARERLNLGDERSGGLNLNAAIPVLRELAADIDNAQRAIGMVLWHLDPTPGELTKLAEELSVRADTLKSWLHTYSRLRHDSEMAALNFSRQQQLARIMNAEDRHQLWTERPENEWTLPLLTTAVDLYLEGRGASVMPRTKKAGCKARFVIDEELVKEAKVNLELLQDSIGVRIAVSGGLELSGMQFDMLSEGVYYLRFDW